MADIRNNKPAEVYPNQPAEVYPDRTAQQRSTRTRQPFLTELYPGATPLPDEPQFKDTARIRGEMADRDGLFINRTVYDRLFTGNPKDSTGVRIHTNTSKPAVTLQLSNNTVPYYSASAEIWKRITGDNVPTNKEIINMQAGDPGYFNKAVQHYTNVPGADYARAGLWRFPVAQMRGYGNKPALVPKLKVADYSNGRWNPDAEEDAKKNESTGSIEIEKSNSHLPIEDEVRFGGFNHTDRDSIGDDIVLRTDAGLGQLYSHEFNHSMSMPAINPHKYVNEVNYEPAFTTIPGSGDTFRWTVVPASGLVAPMYAVAGNESTDYADQYGRPRTQNANTSTSIKPPDHAPRVPSVGMAADYPGFVRPGTIPADPVLRRAPVLYKGEKYTGNRENNGQYKYAYSQTEMTQGLISLNRAQHLLQQNIKKNPQAYIDAGVDPAALDQFMQLPTFLKSPAQLDQRMEFYHNHPEFSALLGQEPARIIPRYFMLERERRNGDQSQEWRDYHQDLFNFTRANYFMARNGSQRQNPMHTGMGKLYNNLA